MNNTLNPYIKWLAHTLMPAFGVGSTLMLNGVQPNTFGFWWAIIGAIVGGLVGKGMTVAGDNQIAKKAQE